MSEVAFSAEYLEQELSQIVGLPLTCLWRALGQIFEFGEQKPFLNRKGEEVCRSDFSVKFLAGWRVSVGVMTVFGSGDHISGKRRFYDRKTRPRDPLNRARWDRAKEFLRRVHEQSLIVESVQVTRSGVVFIRLSDDYEIAGLRTGSFSDDVLYYSAANRSILVCESEMVIKRVD
jgi:hypothetical protein